MTKKNKIEVSEIIESEVLTPEEMKSILKEFQSLKLKISKLPKEEVKAMKKEIGGISRRVISEKLIELRDQLIPILREYREVLKEEFKKTETKEKPQGNKSISLKTDIFTVAIIRSIKK